MNIFKNIRTPEYFASQRKAAHEQYLQRRGITEEEYQLELKEKKEHQEYLDRLGITEEELQRRVKKAERKRAIKESLDKYGTIVAFLGGIALFVFGIVSEDFRKAVSPIILAAGGIWLLFIFIMVCTPIYLFINSFVSQTKCSKFVKVIVSLILTLLILMIIGTLLHACCSGCASDYYEPGKLRPDKF
ncbi:MAG: coiled-coil domain-containing protein [Bacteroidales bacterium]|nr:coiled-coil domain-containing protein [Bacteroidales bacterium]